MHSRDTLGPTWSKVCLVYIPEKACGGRGGQAWEARKRLLEIIHKSGWETKRDGAHLQSQHLGGEGKTIPSSRLAWTT